MTALLITIAIGLLAGWLAGMLWKGQGFGLWVNLAIGVVGSWVGNFVFGLLGLKVMGFLGSIIAATAGALLLLFVVSKLKK
ncbi:MAG: GlsB/YeaQ/YmgE family stress response membrane protein [Spirochaetota bacterium]